MLICLMWELISSHYLAPSDVWCYLCLPTDYVNNPVLWYEGWVTETPHDLHDGKCRHRKLIRLCGCRSSSLCNFCKVTDKLKDTPNRVPFLHLGILPKNTRRNGNRGNVSLTCDYHNTGLFRWTRLVNSKGCVRRNQMYLLKS